MPQEYNPQSAIDNQQSTRLRQGFGGSTEALRAEVDNQQSKWPAPCSASEYLALYG